MDWKSAVLKLLLLVCLLSGCSEPESPLQQMAIDDFGLPLEWDGGPQPSWQTWVARQAQLREGMHGSYRPAYMPEMANWRPEDFLPTEYLQAPMRDICELPQEEQLVLLRTSVEDPEALARLLDYAERGYIQAMSKLGTKFCSFPTGNLPALSRAEGLTWARRAAASGDPYASFTLASCMTWLYVDRDHKAAGLTPAQIDRNSLWIDQVLYWHWRAAQNLEPLALYNLYRGINDYYFPDADLPYTEEHRPETAIESYKWLRLSELGHALHGYTFERRGTEVALERWPQMSAAEIAEAERRVEEFLRRYGGGLSRARYTGYSCQRKMGFDQLNQELKRYGLQVEPEQPWSLPSYPLPALPGPLASAVQAQSGEKLGE